MCGLLALASLLLDAAAAASRDDPWPHSISNSSMEAWFGAQGGAQIDLWLAGEVPGERQGQVGNETHSTGEGGEADRIYHNVSVPTLTPFLVEKGRAAVVIAPGGGYSILAFDREGTDIARWANSVGISAFVLKYRVPGRPWLAFGEAPLMDAQRALSIVRARAHEFGVDPARIGFMGFSAGGHLTAHVSTSYQRRAYARVDDADDASCRPDFSLLIYPWKLVDEADLQTLLVNITGETPPAFLSQAADDFAHVECSIRYYLGLKRAKASPSELHVWPVGGHGYGRCTVNPVPYTEACSWPERAAAFLRHLGVASSAPPPARGARRVGEAQVRTLG